jgi:GDP-L-fucose synthase
MKKVLITGGHGFLGTQVFEEFTKAKYSVFAPGSGRADLRKMEDTLEVVNAVCPDIVVHLAAKVGGIGANKENPGSFFYENMIMGINVVEACRRCSVPKLVVAGTICAYPKFTPVPFKESDLWNGFPEETNAPYGIAKKALLVMCQAYRQQYGSNFIYLLPVNLYGPNDNFNLETSHVIPAMIRKFHEAKMAKSHNVTLWGDGTPTREFLYVNDCAQAFMRAAELYDGPEPINIGSGKEISMASLATAIKDTVGFDGGIVWDSTKPNGQPRRCLDTERAKEKLNWEATTPFNDGLKLTYEWFLSTKGN